MIGPATHILHSGGRPRHTTVRSVDATDHLSRCPGHLADTPGGLENATGHSENAPSGLENATDGPSRRPAESDGHPGEPEGSGDGARSPGAVRREGRAGPWSGLGGARNPGRSTRRRGIRALARAGGVHAFAGEVPEGRPPHAPLWHQRTCGSEVRRGY